MWIDMWQLGRWSTDGWCIFSSDTQMPIKDQYATARLMVIDLAQAMCTAWTRAIVWSNTWRSCTLRLFDLCAVPSPHRLISVRGIYTVIIIRHSSAFRVPALGAPNSYGTLLSQEGVSAVLMTERICSMTSCVPNLAGCGPVDQGFVRRYMTVRIPM